MASKSDKKPRSHVTSNRHPGNTVYVSKAERRRVLKSLKDGLETKKHKSNMCKVTQELTVVLMKLTNLKAQFNDMEEKENIKHLALGKMMDLVRDNICSLLKREDVTVNEISLIVNRVQDIEGLMNRIRNKIDGGIVKIELGTEDKSQEKDVISHRGGPRSAGEAETNRGDHGPMTDHKTYADQKPVHDQKPDLGHKPDDEKPVPSHKAVDDHKGTPDHKPLGDYKPQKEREELKDLKKRPVDREEDHGTSPTFAEDLRLKGHEGTRPDFKKKHSLPEEQQNYEKRSVGRSSYPYGFRDINMRKDQKSHVEPHGRRHTVGMATTYIENHDEGVDCKSIQGWKTAEKKRKNKSVLTHTLLRRECMGTESIILPRKLRRGTKKHSKIVDSSMFPEEDAQSKSSCIFKKLVKNKPTKMINNRGVLSDTSDSSVSGNEFNIEKNVFNCEFENIATDKTKDNEKLLTSTQVHKKTSYDDFILDPKFSWNSPNIESISRKIFVIDRKSWRYKESDYRARMKPTISSSPRKKFNTQATNTSQFYATKKDKLVQTGGNFPSSVRQVCFFRVFYTNSHLTNIQTVDDKLLKFPKGPSIIDKSKGENGFTYITCRADPANRLAHFTLINNFRQSDTSVQKDSVYKLQQVKDMWVQQTKQFFSRFKQKDNFNDCEPLNNISYPEFSKFSPEMKASCVMDSIDKKSTPYVQFSIDSDTSNAISSKTI